MGRSDEAIILTKATIRAAENLSLPQKTLASIIGLSEPTISRMRRGAFVLEQGNGKTFELAQLLVEVYEALSRIVASDDAAACAWLISDNFALSGRPIDRIQTVQGLAEVAGYLRAKSSL